MGIELADPPLFPPIDGDVAVGIVIKTGVGAVEVVLFFVDSDDWIEPDAVERCVQEQQKYKYYI